MKQYKIPLRYLILFFIIVFGTKKSLPQENHQDGRRLSRTLEIVSDDDHEQQQ